jgi:D-alanyl-D-alanine carboxypeptidase
MRRAAVLFCLAVARAAAAQPVLSAESALVYDAVAGRVLWHKNGDVKRFPASTTKIMTGLLLAESTEPNDMIRAHAEAPKVTGSSLHLRPGEGIRSDDLLAAFMLRSGNDAGEAIAHHVAGSVDGFAKLMNDKAEALGLASTRFANPHGLHDPAHYTCARDLAVLAFAALKNERFARAVRLTRITIDRTSNKEDRIIINRNAFLKDDPSAIGVKTGYTKEAGRCFVGAAERGRARIITVVLKSKDWLADQKALNEWAFREFGPLQIAAEGEELGQAVVADGILGRVGAAPGSALWTMAPRSARILGRKAVTKPLKAPVSKGQMVGILETSLSDGSVIEHPLYAMESVEAKSFPWLALIVAGSLGVGGLGAAGMWWAQRKWGR